MVSNLLFNLVPTRKGAEGKANQMLQALSPKGSTYEWQAHDAVGSGDQGGMQLEPGQMEECFGDAIQGLPRGEAANVENKLQKSVGPIWKDEEAWAALN